MNRIDAAADASPPPRPRVLFLNRSYWPDAEATGQLLTELCEDLAGEFDVTVVAGQPNQNPHQLAFRQRGVERHQGVEIRRVGHFRFRKSAFGGRMLNLLSYCVTAGWAALWTPRVDVIVAETDPFLLPLLADALRGWHRCRVVMYLQDIYPDVAVALGKVSPGRLTQTLRNTLFATYRRADRVIVLGEDMKSLLVSSGVPGERIACLPNWADTSQILPVKAHNAFREREGLAGRFVVMHSGNMGLTQRLEHLLEAAARLRHRGDILFLFVGDGAAKSGLQQLAQSRGLANVRFLPYQPKSELASSLSAADLHLVSTDPRINGCLLPSKLYGILAVGTPVLVVAAPGSELCRLVEQHAVGLTAHPNDAAELAAKIEWSADHRPELTAMGSRARSLAVEHFDRRHVTSRFATLLKDVLACNGPEEPAEAQPAASSKRDGDAN